MELETGKGKRVKGKGSGYVKLEMERKEKVKGIKGIRKKMRRERENGNWKLGKGNG